MMAMLDLFSVDLICKISCALVTLRIMRKFCKIIRNKGRDQLKHLKVIVIASAFVFIDISLAIDYCNSDLCPYGRHHIACSAVNSSEWGSECSADSSLEVMTDELKMFILKKHNDARNNIALGKVPGYLTADRMPETSWDMELEKNAEFNVKTCNYGHDQCRNTEKFRSVGQNIGIITGNYTYFKGPTDVINLYFDLWFEEYKDCNMTLIKDYQLVDKNVKIGHFTQIVGMRSKEIGCAMSKFLSGDENEMNFYLVCNYSYGNRISEPIYTAGPTAIKCKSGKSDSYEGLCNYIEDVQPIS